jgi:hypothetical protein
VATDGHEDESSRCPAEMLAILQAWAQDRFPATRGPGLRPSGARAFYYSARELVRRQILPAITVDDPWPPEAGAALQTLAPRVAGHLASDLSKARRLIGARQEERESGQPSAWLENQLRGLLSSHPLRRLPELDWLPEHRSGLGLDLRAAWQTIWEDCWKQAERDHLTLLRALLDSKRLPITVVAPADAAPAEALELLRAQLLRDEVDQWVVPAAELHLYTEAVEDYLLRGILSGEWLLCLCDALARLARQVGNLVRRREKLLKQRRAAARGQLPTADEEDEDTKEAPLPASGQRQKRRGALSRPSLHQRRAPDQPRGVVSAEAIFYYTLAAWPASPDAAQTTPILTTSRRLSPTLVSAFLKRAIKITERLLWDETLPIHAQPADAPERRRLVGAALLPPRLVQPACTLRTREQRAQRLAGGPALPSFAAWDACLQAAMPAINAGLAAVPAPAEISRDQLDTLLQAPSAALAGCYLYQLPFDEWLRAALPPTLPDGDALLEFCRALARQMGARSAANRSSLGGAEACSAGGDAGTGGAGGWPPPVPGGPATVEQAAQAIFWYTKLAIERLIGGVRWPEAIRPPYPTSDQVKAQDQSPARWQGVWLGAPLPAAALELAAGIAPLVSRVLYEAVHEAADEDRPLLLARLRDGEAAAWASIGKLLRDQAQRTRQRDPELAIAEASGALRQQVEQTLLPAEVSLDLLAGRIFSIDSIDIIDRIWYSNSRSTYQFLGGIRSYIRQLIHPAFDQPAEEALGEMESGPEQQRPRLEVALTDDAAIPQALALLVATSKLRPEDARLLANGLRATNTGLSMVLLLAGRGVPEAQAVQRMWLPEAARGMDRAPALEPLPGGLALMAALARLVMDGRVRGEPALRRALGDLFELSQRPAQRCDTCLLPLGVLERMAALAFWPARRQMVEAALAALEPVPFKQRRALCARLLRRADLRLLLALLEGSGWQRPPWLRPEEGASGAEHRPLGLVAPEDRPDALLEQAMEGEEAGPEQRGRSGGGCPQLVLEGRRRWLTSLEVAATTWSGQQTRALIGEWLGIQFWSNLWGQCKQRGQQQAQDQVKGFYTTLLKALPTRLRLTLTGVWRVADSAYQMAMPEVLGLSGSLPPLLPAQVDAPEFFSAVCDFLEACGITGEEAEESVRLHRMRREYQIARCRAVGWCAALASLASEQERRVLLGAMSFARGQPARLERWLKGAALTLQEQQDMFAEIERWPHKSGVRVEDIPALLRSAGRQVWSAWERLRKEID